MKVWTGNCLCACAMKSETVTTQNSLRYVKFLIENRNVVFMMYTDFDRWIVTFGTVMRGPSWTVTLYDLM